MTAYTPGPWRTFDGNPSKIEIICGDRSAPNLWPSAGIRVAEIRFKRQGRGGAFNGNAVDAANARLIAAAPGLLVAARRMLDMLTLDGDPNALAIPAEIEANDQVNEFSQAFADLEAAVAEAEGRALQEKAP
jgi:hypothetical protein